MQHANLNNRHYKDIVTGIKKVNRITSKWKDKNMNWNVNVTLTCTGDDHVYFLDNFIQLDDHIPFHATNNLSMSTDMSIGIIIRFQAI